MEREKQKEEKKAKNPVKICDTTFRDGHQSTIATRFRIEDMEILAPEMNKVGWYSMEVWGGATFDVCTRYLAEDPWDRVRRLKKLMPDTKLQMLLRGQNLVGYRNYPDDVLEAFIYKAAEVGIDIFRVFDALNDERNHEAAYKAIKKVGKHVQGAICYSLTERRMGGPVFNLEYYIKKAKTLVDLGADSICIKDMAGLIAPYDAYELIKALKEELKGIPIDLHSHYTAGLASMSYLKAIEAGVDIVDCALAPFALRTSQPAVEPILVALEGTERDPGLDLDLIFRIGQKLEELAPKYRDFLDTTRMAVIDTRVLRYQIPGGMTSNFIAQLRQANALDRLEEVFEELPRTRKELGYPPLVTPTSQIVGIQAVFNVLFDRYKMVSDEIKDYCYGLYGRPPAPIDPEIQKQVLKGYPRGEEPIACRPADILEPEMSKAWEAIKGISDKEEDAITVALYPTTGLAFVKYKYGKGPLPPTAEKPKTLEDIKREDELIAKAKRGELVEKPKKEVPAKGPGIRTFHVFVDEEYFKVEVEPAEGGSAITITAPPKVEAKVETKAEAKPEPKVESKAPAEVKAPPAEGVEVLAPMPGVIIEYKVKEGDKVKPGDPVVVLEAMKMKNVIPAPEGGVVKAINYKPGDTVEAKAVLAVIAKE